MREWIKKGIDAYLDLKSFKTEHPIVVIESDDWGSLRTKDKQSRDRLNSINNRIKNDAYIQLDSIAAADDLEALFEVLQSVKDRNENPACITPNVCTANPDFDKIKASNYGQFFYKPFTQTLEEYSNSVSLFEIWEKGIEEKVFKPQLHGREHVHALAWLAELRAGNKGLLKAFEEDTWGIRYDALLKKRRQNLQASLDIYNFKNEDLYHQNWIKESVDLFQKSFKYQPKSFIAPAYTWHPKINKQLVLNNIKTVQGIKIQTCPLINKNKKYKEILHYIGQIDKKSNIIYTNRNSFFEPYTAPDKDWVDICMSGVKRAIDLKKPIIIGSHRINYVGRLDTKHRDKNLKTLKLILKQIVKHYPDVEFIDSGQLADIIY
jgi:hypothetical protein